MVYSITGTGFNKKAIINGSDGIYGQPKPDNAGIYNEQSSTNYGRNAINNFHEYNKKELGKEIEFNNPPALDYEVKYLPENTANKDNLNTMALLGASYEDLSHINDAAKKFDELAVKQGKQPPFLSITQDKDGAVSLKDMNELAKHSLGEKAGYDAYDINNDGKIDVSENAVATLISDMSDNQEANNPSLSPTNIDGKYTRNGLNNSTFMLAKDNVDNNKNIAKQVYDYFNLGKAQNQFLTLTKR